MVVMMTRYESLIVRSSLSARGVSARRATQERRDGSEDKPDVTPCHDLPSRRGLRDINLARDQALGGSGAGVLEREADLRCAVFGQLLGALLAVRLNARSDHEDGSMGELRAQAPADVTGLREPTGRDRDDAHEIRLPLHDGRQLGAEVSRAH